jgi:hypothetical protein
VFQNEAWARQSLTAKPKILAAGYEMQDWTTNLLCGRILAT